MNKKTTYCKLLILFLLILISFVNISFAATSIVTPVSIEPEEYNITLLNIPREDIEKIEIFIPWGYFDDFDDNDKTEIDGRLFNYNNNYYNGVTGTEYNGIKCKIIGTIKQKELKKTISGIKFSIARKDYPFDNIFGFNLRIFKENGEVIYTEFIRGSGFQIGPGIYVVGNYNKDNLWITPVYKTIDEYPTFKETQLYLTIFVTMPLIFILLIIILIYKKKKKHIDKILK